MDRHDSGFTLVELLIVIVVLGVLSSVSVFAVRGITSRGEIEGCSADLDVLIKAQESHETLFGGSGVPPLREGGAGRLPAPSTIAVPPRTNGTMTSSTL